MANGEPITTDHEHIPKGDAARSQLNNLASEPSPTPADMCQESELCSQLATTTWTKTPDRSPSLGELRQDLLESTGNNDIAQCIDGIEQAQQYQASQGKTTDSSNEAHQGADPVMMFNGQYVYTAQDFKINGAGMDFIFTRTYKNQTYYEGPLGVNWDYNYNLYLRVEFGGIVLVRSSGELREDRYVLHQQHNYYIPPEGYHDVIIEKSHFSDHAGLLECCADDWRPGHSLSYILRTPGGTCFLYSQIPGIDLHRVHKIRDRFGNYLHFYYNSDNRLDVVEVNHPERKVLFHYDELNRIREIRTYGVTYPWRGGRHERVWSYEYDDLGDLTAVTTPATLAYPLNDSKPKVKGFPKGLTTCYEYSTAYQVGELRHNLIRIIDPAGQLYLENEFGDGPGLLNFNRVVRQRQGRGQFHFEYFDIVPEGDWDYAPEEQPAHKTIFYERDGHPIELFYNKVGKLLVRRETVRNECGHKTLTSRFRYNKDGALVASLSPEGSVIQNYYGREDFYGRPLNPGDKTLEPALDPNLTPEERIHFGNLLATIRRGLKFDFLSLISRIPDQDGFKDFFPNILNQTDPSDIIGKFTYTNDYQQIHTSSDPRHTTSADPRGREPASYNDHLTHYEYGPAPESLLLRIWHPNPRLPNGNLGSPQGINEEFLEYDPHGRLISSRDAAGNLALRQYYPANAGVREGYLQKEIRQQARINLGTEAPDVAHIRWSRGWAIQRSHRFSDGGTRRRFELVFMGSRLVLYQDEDETVQRGNQVAVKVQIIDANGTVSALQDWDQTRDPAYPIEGLASGKYTVRLRAPRGATASLGRVDVFQETEYEVNEAGLIIAVINARGLRSETVINELDQAIATVAPPPFLFKTYTSYNPNKLVAKIYRELDQPVEGSGYQLSTYKYDEQGKLVEESLGGDTTGRLATQHTYDSSDRRIKTILPRGTSIHYRYDERGRQTEVIRAPCTPDESIVRTVYDGDDRRITIIDPLGHVTRYIYDPLGRLALVEDALGNIKRYTYDELDNIFGEYFFEKRSGRFYLLTRSSYDYDEMGRMRRGINFLFRNPIGALGFDPSQVHLNPDDPAQFVAVKNAVDNGLVGEVITDLYLDEKGRLFRSERYGRVPDPVTHILAETSRPVSEQRYDSLDRVVWARDALGNYTVTIYDPNGNIIRTDTHEVVLDPATQALRYEEIFSSVNTYDEVDRLTASIDSLGNRTEMRYDSRGNLIGKVDTLRNITRWEYDIFGRQVCSINELTPTGLGDADSITEIYTRFVYDANGNLTDMVDPKGVITHHEYDSFDRCIRTQYNYPHDNSYQEWRYDAASLIRSYRDNNGLIHHYSYDPLNRRFETRLDTAEIVNTEFQADDIDDVESITYDGLGRILKESNKHSSIEITYDSLSRPLDEKLWYIPAPAGVVQPQVIKREFDIFSNLTMLTYPDNREIQYVHDALNRVVRVQNLANGNNYPGNPATPDNYEILRHDYQGLRLFARHHSNRTGTRLSYDGAGCVIGLRHFGRRDRRLLDIQQLYDGIGNKRFEINVQRDPVSPNRMQSSIERYQYDSLYRLTHYRRAAMQTINLADFRPPRMVLPESELTGQQKIDLVIGNLAQVSAYTYLYDQSGNRLESREPNEAPKSYSPDLLNQYQQITENGAVIRPVYDPAGNVIVLDSRRYHYNHRHQLTRVEDGRQQTALFQYDARGRLLVASYPHTNEQIHFVYDGLNVIAEYQSSPAGWKCTAQYVNGRSPDSRYQLAEDSQEYWYHKNNVGSTRLLTDTNGGIISYSYEPFGKLRASSPGSLPHNPYRFSGRRYDSYIDAYDFRTRVYLPEWGRFLQRDPKGEIDGPNLYTAMNNNPGFFVDPLGMEKIDTRDQSESDLLKDTGPASEWQIDWKDIASNAEELSEELLDPGNVRKLETEARMARRTARTAEELVRLRKQGDLPEGPKIRILRNQARAAQEAESLANKALESAIKQTAKREGSMFGKALKGTKMAGKAVGVIGDVTDTSPAISGEFPNILFDVHYGNRLEWETDYILQEWFGKATYIKVRNPDGTFELRRIVVPKPWTTGGTNMPDPTAPPIPPLPEPDPIGKEFFEGLANRMELYYVRMNRMLPP